ncbi:hypothetical protein FOA52_001681 [Chlamydomonas sp. UWO 241]|nr:hypothetical protein FOA52_001681 [Chlamydomonas sp. UWO 241]
MAYVPLYCCACAGPIGHPHGLQGAVEDVAAWALPLGEMLWLEQLRVLAPAHGELGAFTSGVLAYEDFGVVDGEEGEDGLALNPISWQMGEAIARDGDGSPGSRPGIACHSDCCDLLMRRLEGAQPPVPPAAFANAYHRTLRVLWALHEGGGGAGADALQRAEAQEVLLNTLMPGVDYGDGVIARCDQYYEFEAGHEWLACSPAAAEGDDRARRNRERIDKVVSQLLDKLYTSWVPLEAGWEERAKSKINATAIVTVLASSKHAYSKNRSLFSEVPRNVFGYSLGMAAFCALQESMRSVRGTHDSLNSLVAGAVAGAVVAGHYQGPQYRLLGATLWGPICCVTHLINDALHPRLLLEDFLVSEGLLDPSVLDRRMPQSTPHELYSSVDRTHMGDLIDSATRVRDRELSELLLQQAGRPNALTGGAGRPGWAEGGGGGGTQARGGAAATATAAAATPPVGGGREARGGSAAGGSAAGGSGGDGDVDDDFDEADFSRWMASASASGASNVITGDEPAPGSGAARRRGGGGGGRAGEDSEAAPQRTWSAWASASHMGTDETQEVGGSATPPPNAVSATPLATPLKKTVGGAKHRVVGILLPVANKLTETVTSTKWFSRTAKKSFDDFDLDKNGSLNASELFACLLKMYDEVNFRLPTHVMGPTRSEVTALMKKYDVNESGGLEFEEFLKVARSVMGVSNITHSIPINCTVIILLRLALLPLIAGRIISAAKAIGGWAVLLFHTLRIADASHSSDALAVVLAVVQAQTQQIASLVDLVHLLAVGGWAVVLAYPGVGVYVVIMEMVLKSWWVSFLKPL